MGAFKVQWPQWKLRKLFGCHWKWNSNHFFIYFLFISFFLNKLYEFHVDFSVDERCDMELDETDPTVWMKLEAATVEYIQKNTLVLKNVCERLLQNQNDEKMSDILKHQQFLQLKGSSSGKSWIPFQMVDLRFYKALTCSTFIWHVGYMHLYFIYTCNKMKGCLFGRGIK